jgi:hypothetical protein
MSDMLSSWMVCRSRVFDPEYDSMFRRIKQAFLTGQIKEDTKFDSTDFRNNVPRFSAENRKRRNGGFIRCSPT